MMLPGMKQQARLSGRVFRATICLVGLFGKDKKKGQGSDWVQPGQMISQFGGPGGPPGAGGAPVPARLRPMTEAGNSGWLKGALVLSAGSLLWQPDGGVSAQPVELATAAIVPWLPGRGGGGSAIVTNLETPAGQFQLEMDPELFEMSQLLVAEAAGQQGPGDLGSWGDQVPPPGPI
jgi:hypothetical protein